MYETEFWDADKLFHERLKGGDTDGAKRALHQMTQFYPQLNDNDLAGNKAIMHHALALDKVIVNFNIAYFVPYAMRLADYDWSGESHNGSIVPSLGQRITNRLMRGIAEQPDTYIKAVMPFFRKALQHNPSNKDNQRNLAQLYVRVRLRSQAISIYKQLLRRYHDSYLYSELAELLDDPKERIALFSQAIVHQPKEAYNMANRARLAELLQMPEPTRAVFEINKSIFARKKSKQQIPANVERIGRILADYTPVTEAEEQLFYQKLKPLADKVINS